MTRLVILAALFGSIGGILKSVCLAIYWLFKPPGGGIYTTFAGLYISQILFVTPICLTKGFAEKSESLVKRGAVGGILTGVIATSITLAVMFFRARGAVFFASWFDHIFVTTALLGVTAGFICGGGNHVKTYIYLVVGLVAGVVASLSHHFTTVLITAIAFVLSWLSFHLSVFFHKLAIHPADGVAQSVIIWCCIALCEKYLISRYSR